MTDLDLTIAENDVVSSDDDTETNKNEQLTDQVKSVNIAPNETFRQKLKQHF